MFTVKRRDLSIDPGPIDLRRQALQLMLGVDDLIEPGPEQIIRLRRLALLGSHANLRRQANHRRGGGSIAKNEIARFGHLMAPDPAIPNLPPADSVSIPYKIFKDDWLDRVEVEFPSKMLLAAHAELASL